MMGSERLNIVAADGRNVAIWRSWEEEAPPPRAIVVLSAGFARRMRHVGGIAAYLTANGAVVYRYDPLDGLGLSDGDIRDHTGTAFYDSMLRTLELATAREAPSLPLVIVAASLAALPAFRLASENRRVARVVCLVGVVDGRKTLARVFGHDYAECAQHELPEFVTFEKHRIDPRPLFRDFQRTQWPTTAGTIAELQRVAAPVVNILARDDAWVRVAEVEEVFAAGNGGPRAIYELPHGEHDLSQNPVALRIVLRKLTAAALAADYSSAGDDVVEPTFEYLVDLIIKEREWEAAQQISSGSEEGRAPLR